MWGTSNRRAFTLRDLLIVIGVIAVLLAITVPFIQQAREVSRMHECQNNLKQLMLGTLNFEDHGRCVPPISTNASFANEASNDAAGPGYSWIVAILPDIEESELFQAIFTPAQKFQHPGFSFERFTSDGRRVASAQIRHLLCPSFANGASLDDSPRTIGASGTLEAGTLPAYYAPFCGPKRDGLGITNYNGIISTHIDPAFKSAAKPNNGGMLFRGADFWSGRKVAALVDGTSKVPLVCETRERRFSSWYDGTMNWVVAARHSDPANPSTALSVPVSAASVRSPISIGGPPLPPDRLIVGTDGTPKTGGHALNVGPSPATPTAVYLPAAALNDPDISSAPPGRLWGPSSMHRNGLVNHVFADGHVVAISDQIDPNMYLWIVTRNGGEPSDPGQ
jgi:type II secretory pathway pseudopilin PulG